MHRVYGRQSQHADYRCIALFSYHQLTASMSNLFIVGATCRTDIHKRSLCGKSADGLEHCTWLICAVYGRVVGWKWLKINIDKLLMLLVPDCKGVCIVACAGIL